MTSLTQVKEILCEMMMTSQMKMKILLPREIFPMRGEILPCPEYQMMKKRRKLKVQVPEGGKYNLRPNPNPIFSDEYRY